jgi:RES domain
VILWRVFPWQPGAQPAEPGGPLFAPRAFQVGGRHDNRARYGCLYASIEPAAAVAELLAQFRGGPLEAGLFELDGAAVSLVAVDLAPDAPLIDLDEPRVLERERLRPSQVATRERTATQGYAERLFDGHPEALGLRWWSTLESSWINVTLFDRAIPELTAARPEELTLEHPAVVEAADLLGLEY